MNWDKFTFDLEEGEISAELSGELCKFKCLGGGRIEHSQLKFMDILGYMGNVIISADILQNICVYDEMNTSNHGY